MPFAAERIVLVQPAAASSVRTMATAVVSLRGALPQVQLTFETASPLLSKQHVQSDDLLLLVLNAGDAGWQALGSLAASREPWLRGLAQPQTAAQRADAVLTQARRTARDLEDDYPLVAQAAYDDISAQPYAVLRGLASTLDARRVAHWVKDPSRSARRSLYYLLLGLSGTTTDADAITTQALRAEPRRSAAELSAMLAAYGRFIHANPHRAGFAASDLANWGHWEFAEAFAVALRSGSAQVLASRYAMLIYLLRNPQPEAKRLVETLRAEKLL